MMDLTDSNLREITYEGDFWLNTDLGILDGVWGPGLPTRRIFEMHSDLGIDMVKIALQSAAGVVRRGLDVTFLDVNNSLTDDLVSRYITDMSPIGDRGMGRFEVFHPKTFDEAISVVHGTCSAKNWSPLVIIDSFTDLREPADDLEAEDTDTPSGHVEKEELQEQFLLHCRDVFFDTIQSLLLLTHVPAVTDSPGASPACTARWGQICDTRIAIALARDFVFPDGREFDTPPPGFLTWRTRDYRSKHSPVMPMLPASDGKIDDPISVLTYLIQNKVITWEDDDFNVPGVDAPIVGLDALRRWVVDNDREARKLVREVSPS